MRISLLVISLASMLTLGAGIESCQAEYEAQTTAFSQQVRLHDAFIGEDSSIVKDELPRGIKGSEEPAVEQTEALAGRQKARVAVVPAVYRSGARSTFEREFYEKLGVTDPSKIENPEFTQHIVDALVNSGKFNVLEREALRAVAKEIDFGESDYADVRRTVRMGRMLNAQYVLIPVVHTIDVLQRKVDVPYIGGTRVRYEAKMVTHVRVVDVGTSRLVSSNLDETLYKETAKRKDPFVASQVQTFISNLYAAAARRAVSKIIDVIYPMKILVVEGETVTLNRGEGSIVPGEILLIFRPGQPIVDPDTKERLGVTETLVGRLMVTEVKAKVAIGRILERTDKIEKLFICRREIKSEKLND